MKKVIWMSLLGLMVGATACEDNKTEFLEDYATTMYIRNSGVQELTCYVTGEDTKYSFSVVKAGNEEKALSDATISVMDAAQLAIYNSENGTSYEMMPSNCYEFISETELNFAADDLYKLVDLNLKPAAIKALGEGDYVLPLALSSSKKVNEEKNFLLIKPTAVSIRLAMEVEQGQVISMPRGRGVIEIPLKLQIENMWDFTAKVSVDAATTTMDANSFTLKNDGVVQFTSDGTDSEGILEIEVNGFEGLTSGNIGLKIESLSNAFDFDPVVYQISCSKQYPLTPQMLFSNAVEPSEGSLANLLDNNKDTYFHTAWSVAVNGTHYVMVTLPEAISEFSFSYTNRSSNANAALYGLKVYAGNDQASLSQAGHFTWEDANPLPWNTPGGVFESNTIKLSEPCKIFRFDNDGSTGGAWFVWSEFKFYVFE